MRSHLTGSLAIICFLQGRGTSTHAYTHSLDTDHHVYLNLATLKFYCLPDNYEVIDPSLEDIQYVLKPTYEPEHIKRIDTQTKMARAFDGTVYYPGVVGRRCFIAHFITPQLVGLNNIKANDYINVILHVGS